MPGRPTSAAVRLQRFEAPLAFLADVQGNLEALDAVIAACRGVGVSEFFVAGGLLYPGSAPLDVWKRLTEIHAHCTRAVADLALATIDPDVLPIRGEQERATVDRFRATRAALGDLVLERVKRLPESLRIELGTGDEIVVVHGSPADSTEPITHDLDEDELSLLLSDDPADIVVCAGDVPFVRAVGDVRIVGLGGVGDGVAGRAAHFALIEPTDDGLRIDPRWVAY